MDLVVHSHFENAGQIPVQISYCQFSIMGKEHVSYFSTNFRILKTARSSGKN
jgi:hypothetical protein